MANIFEKYNLNNYSPALLKKLYFDMLRIRKAEEAVVKYYPEQEMRCPTHICIGQEATPAGVCANLRKEDYVFTTYRSHGHYLAKGGDLNAMMAEMYGKETGCSKGMGGSMHFVDRKAGVMGSTAVAGGCVPIAMGSAMSFQMNNKDLVSVAFFGDGSTEEGYFWETMNYAALKKLPIIFVCENNFYAVQTSIFKRQVGRIYKKAEAFCVKSDIADGNNVLEVYEKSKKMIEGARNGEGPFFLECETYRWREHCGPLWDYEMGYRTKEEIDEWIKKCPVQNFEEYLLENKVLSVEEIEKMKVELDIEMEKSIKFAKESPWPKGEQIIDCVY